MNGLGEVVTIFIGQAGTQVANACWELFCLEHGVLPNGCIRPDYRPLDMSFWTFFCEAQVRTHINGRDDPGWKGRMSIERMMNELADEKIDTANGDRGSGTYGNRRDQNGRVQEAVLSTVVDLCEGGCGQ